MNKKMVKNMAVAGLALTMGASFASVASASENYVVKQGDTVSKIANAHNITIWDIQNANHLEDVNTIYVGDTLILPTESAYKQQYTQPVQQDKLQTEPTQEQMAYMPTAEEQQHSVTIPTTKNNKYTDDGSVKSEFLANGGTEAMWNNIVMPESGGNPNALSADGYRGLGQTKMSWGTGSVAEQTKGMVNYAVSRYGSVDNAVQFRQANGWW